MSEKNTGWDLSNRVFSLVALLGVAVSLFWAFRIAQIWREINGDYSREISVEGTGEAYSVPDRAVVNLGVTTEAATSEEAVSQNTEKMNAVLEAVKALGVAEEDIQTTGYYLNPKYNWTDEGQVDDGYTLTQNLEVKLTDFDLIGDLIANASGAGANMVGGVTFTVEDGEAAKQEARIEAVAEAKLKAEQIAEASGLTLGDVVSYYEYSSDSGKGGYYDMAEASFDGEKSVPTIEPGQEEVSLTVTLSYQLR